MQPGTATQARDASPAEEKLNRGAVMQSATEVCRQPRTDRQGNLAYLNGLRGVLAAIVVLWHIYLTVNLSEAHGFSRAVGMFFAFFHGHYSVDWFIVLSGFCLTLPLARESRPVDAGWSLRFLGRRFVRIVLPYWAAIGFSLMCIWLLIGTGTGTHWDVAIPVSRHDIVAHILLLQDFLHAVPKINHAFWSISVEWHIYFFFPLLAALFLRFPADGPRLAITAGGIVLSFLIFKALVPYFGTNHSMTYLGLFTMGILGCWVAFGDTLRRIPSRIWGLAFVNCVGIGFLIRTTPLRWHVAGHNFDYLVGFSAMCALVWLAKRPDSMPCRLLSTTPASRTGEFAFSTYLIHAPLIQIAWQYLFSGARSHPALMFALLCTLGIGFIYLASYIFYRIIENPCHRLAKRI